MVAMDRLARMDRRTGYAVGGAVAFVGVLLLVLGWYLISGEAVAAKQLPYLASASLPGAALVVCGTLLALTGHKDRDAEYARMLEELYTLLTEAVEAEPAAEPDGTRPPPTESEL
jgi:hypothetical protein